MGANEQLRAAVRILATHPGPIKDRLVAAFLGPLHGLPRDVLPQHARGPWADVLTRVTAIKAKDSTGSLICSIAAFDDDEAAHVATSILSIEALVNGALAIR